MPQYAVVLLYPDYLTDNFGQETYTEIVDAAYTAEAVAKIQVAAAVANNINTPEDFLPLAAITGHDLMIA